MTKRQFIDFFDPEIQNIASEDGCSIYKMKNMTGEGIITRYEILPGIELFYNDFHMSDGQNQNKLPHPDVLEINHCREGINVRDYTLDSLMSNISEVFQKVYLFADTIENNIKFGKPTASHEEVVEAAKKACCNDFIMDLPDGYNTVIGEKGATLSGGEKQRISIARAILKDSPITILDEATSSVDPENENCLWKPLRN